MKVSAGRTQDMKIQNNLVKALLQDHGGFYGVQYWKSTRLLYWFASPKDA
jgi:hypothetical protein